LIILVATAVRIYPSAGFVAMGFDEALYRDNVLRLDTVGLTGYPEICQLFLEDQRQPEQITKLPPTRFLYIFSGWIWKRIQFGDAPPAVRGSSGFADRDPALRSLHGVSCLFSILTVVAAGLAAHRMLGPGITLGVLALVAFTPTQIHMGQHALIDGFLAFWATMCVWMLWENLQNQGRGKWLAGYGLCLACMVMTKENSFFVYVALSGLLAVSHRAGFGRITRSLLVVHLAAPAIGLLVLITLAGGIASFVEIYQLLVVKAQNLTYAIQTGDGPWHRYLVDMMIVSPLILCLAIGGLFSQLHRHRAYLYLALFVLLTYAVMCNVRYAMNLRYATIWDLPLCAFAAAQINQLSAVFGRRRQLAATLLTVAVCAYGLRQYLIFFCDFALYELVTEGLLRAVKILK
jgi:4-amino-4-deoxy-L-arabinose transferase-like glycosyltransferase